MRQNKQKLKGDVEITVSNLIKSAKIQLELQYQQTIGRLEKLEVAMRENDLGWSEQSELQHLRELIERIKRAQARVLNGGYGRCLDCGNPINPERLVLVPYAEVCMDCHQKNVNRTLQSHRLIPAFG